MPLSKFEENKLLTISGYDNVAGNKCSKILKFVIKSIRHLQLLFHRVVTSHSPSLNPCIELTPHILRSQEPPTIMFGFGRKTEPTKVWKVEKDKPLVTKTFSDPPENLAHKPTYEEIEKAAHEEIYNNVLTHFKNTELYPTRETNCPQSEFKPLNKFEKVWLSKQCLLRYLRACDWKEKEAINRITTSIGWRREFGIAGGEFDKVTSDLVKVENETGKHQIFGFDDEKRPCLILLNGRQNTKTSDRQIQHLIYMLERSIDFMPQGQDKLCLCVDFKKYPEACTYDPKVPAVGVGKSVLYILQYHYPERLGRALFINIPSLVNIFLKICWPFVDPYTKQKCKFDEPFEQFITPEQLAYNYGGDVNFEYVHDDYWDDFVEKAEKKRAVIIENFEKLGGEIGLSEWDLRDGV